MNKIQNLSLSLRALQQNCLNQKLCACWACGWPKLWKSNILWKCFSNPASPSAITNLSIFQSVFLHFAFKSEWEREKISYPKINWKSFDQHKLIFYVKNVICGSTSPLYSLHEKFLLALNSWRQHRHFCFALLFFFLLWNLSHLLWWICYDQGYVFKVSST